MDRIASTRLKTDDIQQGGDIFRPNALRLFRISNVYLKPSQPMLGTFSLEIYEFQYDNGQYFYEITCSHKFNTLEHEMNFSTVVDSNESRAFTKAASHIAYMIKAML